MLQDSNNKIHPLKWFFVYKALFRSEKFHFDNTKIVRPDSFIVSSNPRALSSLIKVEEVQIKYNEEESLKSENSIKFSYLRCIN